MRPDPLRIVVAGMVAAVPHHGGATWAVLQWVLGLRRMGHEVLLVEPVERATCDQLGYFHDVADRFGLGDDAAAVTAERAAYGRSFGDVVDFVAGADVLFNLGGTLRDRELLEQPATRAYVDLDPAFTQLWHDVDGIDMGFAGHTHFVTVGLEIGQPRCVVPTCGRTWIPTLPPVVLDEWPVTDAVTVDAFTSVASWRGYGSIEHHGVHHGQKAHSWRALAELPRHVDASLLPALGIHPDEHADIALLEEHGWQWLDPLDVAATPDSYRELVSGSRAELGVAKSGYVASQCGWFSDRSACYLASGRPVVAQETGWSRHLPAGDGLLAFTDVADAVEAIGRVQHDYERHRVAARRLAEAHFDAASVLTRLLDEVSA